MSISETVSTILKDGGHTQKWVAKKMNEKDASLKMNGTKISAIVQGKRTMSIDEMVAFCSATGITPDDFTDMALERTGK